MTSPIEAEEDFSLDGWDGPIVGAGLSDLANRTQENVTDAKLDEIESADPVQLVFNLLWDGLENTLSFPGALLAGLLEALTPGTELSTDSVTDLLASVEEVPPLKGLANAVAGVSEGDLTDISTWANSVSVTSAISSLNAAVAELPPGVSSVVNFAALPSGSTFGDDFTHYRDGGAGHYEIISGTGARWDSVNDSDATDNFVYDALETSGEYQKIWFVFSAAPAIFSSSARNEIHGRKNPDGDTYVFAGIERTKADIGCVVEGTPIVFETETEFTAKPNTLYALECGTTDDVRAFRLWEGDTIVIDHLEVGTTSEVGAGYRLSGGLGLAKATVFGTTPPGTMVAMAVGDNEETP